MRNHCQEVETMSSKEELIQLRKSTGMNRKQFCDYFQIPYRTMTDWELGNRTMPDYLLRLMAYKVNVEKLAKNCEQQLVTYCHQLKMNERMKDMNIEQVQLFEEQTIRTAWDEENEEWYFLIVDVVGL